MEAADLFRVPETESAKVLEFLESRGFRDPGQADLHLQKIARQTGSPETLAPLAPALVGALCETADPDAALLHLSSFLEAVPSPAGLIARLKDDPRAPVTLATLLGHSPFLAQILFRNPEYFYWLMEGGRLDRPEGSAYFQTQAREAASSQNREKDLQALRRYRRRELLRIASQDVLGRVRFGLLVQQISDLTDSILQSTFATLSGNRFGEGGFAVLALGKLGGRELNYSSDIDLIYLYRDPSLSEAARPFAREYTRVLSEHTAEGRLFRVDLRLRPSGRSGEIAYPLQGALNYYENWADTFDRLALIKCRFVAGDPELGGRFLEAIEKYIYKRYLDVAAVEEIRWLKKRIDRQLEAEERNRNIKLGLGGIREIEFFVQAFQLLYAGEHPGLRKSNTLTALDALVDNGFIPPADHQTLRSAYAFLRHLEHRLQLFHDLQIHSLPEQPDALEAYAHKMGYGQEGVSAFLSDLKEHSRNVHQLFSSLFETERKPVGSEELLLNPEISEPQAVGRLRDQGVIRPRDFYRALIDLAQASAFPHSPAKVRNLLANLLPRLVETVRWTEQPARLLARLDRFCQALGSRAALYSSLVENRTLATRVLTLLASGDFMSEALIRNPELLDAVSRPLPPDVSRAGLDAFMEGQADPSLALRLFKHREEFKTGLHDLFQPETLPTRELLSELAESCLEHVLEKLCRRVDIPREEVTLLALGKLGGRSLTYHSDLDLVVIYSDRTGLADEQFQKLARRLRQEVEAYTDLGPAYKLDFRLRPEGNKGPLAISASHLTAYFHDRAQAWERLAYVKARPLSPLPALPAWQETLWSRGLDQQDLEALAQVRRRKEVELAGEDRAGHFDLKSGPGGLLDVYFAVHALQLRHRLPEPRTLAALNLLGGRDCLPARARAALDSGFRFLSRLETLVQLIEEKPVHTISRDGARNRKLAHLMGMGSGEDLVDALGACREKVREAYLQVFPT